jgi:AAA domain (Cdc48 subfamily)
MLGMTVVEASLPTTLDANRTVSSSLMSKNFCWFDKHSTDPSSFRLEKAAKEFVTIFLQVLDDGRLTDSHGRVVDFRNTVIIFTSNVGSAFLTAMGQGPVPSSIRSSVMNAIRATWPPEFLNRIDSIIIYVGIPFPSRTSCR